MERTEFFARDGRTAGIRGSPFVRAGKPWPWSIKLEGARRLGARNVSLLYVDPADLPKLPADVLVYGRNGVQARPVERGERELGIVIETRAKTEEAAVLLASLLTHYLIHYGYPGRRPPPATSLIRYRPTWCASGTTTDRSAPCAERHARPPAFFENYAAIEAAVIRLIQDTFPDALANAWFTIVDADETNPAVLLRTVDRNPQRLAARHRQEIDRIAAAAAPKPGSLLNLDAAEAYAWSLYHLLRNEAIIKDEMFPVTYFAANGATWTRTNTERPRYFDIGETGYGGNVDDRTLSLIADLPPTGRLHVTRRLLDIAVVIPARMRG
jgi:hypothetical protein